MVRAPGHFSIYTQWTRQIPARKDFRAAWQIQTRAELFSFQEARDYFETAPSLPDSASAATPWTRMTTSPTAALPDLENGQIHEQIKFCTSAYGFHISRL